MSVDFKTIADIDLAGVVGLAIVVEWTQNRSAILRDTEGRSIWRGLPCLLHHGLDIICHASRFVLVGGFVGDTGGCGVIMEYTRSLGMSQAPVNLFDNVVGIGDVGVDCWVEWVDLFG